MTVFVIAMLACSGGAPVDETQTDKVQQPPWRIDFYDGSGNSYRFDRKSAADLVTATYDPVDPARSSSGLYSGGDPWRSDLDDAEAAELWRWVDGLMEDVELHAERRGKGTGLIRIRAQGGEQSVIVARGTQLAAFETYLPSLK